MTKIVFTLSMLLITVVAPAQDTAQVRLIGTDYAAKAKRERTAGWVLTGVGVGGLLATLVADASHSAGGVFVYAISLGSIEPERKSFVAPYLLSGVAVIAGITQFANSKSSRRKSGDVYGFLQTGSTQVARRSGVHRQAIPVAGVRVAL